MCFIKRVMGKSLQFAIKRTIYFILSLTFRKVESKRWHSMGKFPRGLVLMKQFLKDLPLVLYYL